MNKRQPRPAARRQQPSALRRPKSLRLTLSFLLVAFALVGYHFLSAPPPVEALSSNIVISQIYGAGGNVGATYNQDYIELYNRGATAVNITGWTLQYASAAGNFSTGAASALTLSGTINPGQYFLVAASTPPGGAGINIPTPDQSINFGMAPGGGKVVLRNTSPGFNGVACPGGSPNPSDASIVDFVGYGTATCYEGASPAPANSTTTATLRKGNGTVETDNNSLDFTAAAPNPRNSSTFSNANTIAFDSSSQGCNFFPGTLSSTFTWNHTILSGANRVLIVGVSTSFETLPLGVPTDRVLSVTYNGQQMTRLGTIVNTSDARVAVEMFRLKEVEASPAATLPPAGTYPVVVNLITPLTPDYAVGGAASFSGVNQATPNGAFQSTFGNSTTPSVIVPSAGNQLVIDTVATTFTGGTLLVGAGQTERWNGLSCFGGINSIGAGSTEVGATTTTMSWTQTTAQPWAIGAVALMPVAPTAVELASFEATETSAGVRLNWQTGYEVDNLGFNLYREQNGKRTRVNPSIIAGSALLAGPGTRLTAGESYTWLDRSAKNKESVQYWLEDIDLDGTRKLHGPISPVAGEDSRAVSDEQAALLGELNQSPSGKSSVTGYPAQQTLSAPQLAQAQVLESATPARLNKSKALLGRLLLFSEELIDTILSETPPSDNRLSRFEDTSLIRQRALAAAPAVKISVQQAGWYRVTQPELVAAGLSPAADPGRLQLYAEGVEQPIMVRGSSQQQFGADGSIEFYGTGVNTLATDTRIYWLVAGTLPGKRIGGQNNQSKSEAALDSPTGGTAAKPQPNIVAGTTAKPVDTGTSPAPAITKPSAQPWYILVNPPSAVSSEAPKASKKKKTAKKRNRQKLLRERQHAFVKRGAQALQEAPSSKGFAYTWERKDHAFYFAALLNGEADNFFGPLILGTPTKQDLNITGIDTSASTPATLEVALQGLTVQQHQVRVMLNGAELGVINFADQEHPVGKFTLPRSSLLEGNNSVTLVSLNGASDINLVDYVRLNYWHAYRAENDTLTCISQHTTPLSIDGFTSPKIRVFDITDQTAVEQLNVKVSPQGTGYAVKIPGGRGTPRLLLALTDSQIQQPAAIKANEPSNLSASTNRADFVILTHRDFRDAVKPLADLRRSQGLETAVIDVEDIYDEFSYSEHSSQAIRSFLSLAKNNWTLAPRYALFVGDTSIDPRNYLGFGNQDFVPTKLVDTAQLETASDDTLCDFNGDGVADIAIGRLPVRTLQQAQKLIAKITAYAPGQTVNGALLVSDHLDGYDFEAASNQVRGLLPENLSVTVVNRRDNPTEQVKSEIINGINAGPLLVNYAGHGSSDIWTGAGILKSTDALSLTNTNRLPLFVLMTCLNGRFQDPNRESLAEALMKADNGGAIAVWASSGLTQPDAQAAVDQHLMRLLFGNGQSPMLGDAVRGAKAVTTDMDVRRTWIFFGDPTLRIR